ncbi:hypothetical protein [Microbacterium sp. GXF7504]
MGSRVAAQSARLGRMLRDAWGRVVGDDRGDVPGWVLITLMTAGLVVVIWALAGPALSGLFEQAISRVSGF